MFSEYASKYIKSQRASAPLFNAGAPDDSDVDNYLEAVSGSTDDDSLNSDSDSSSLHSDSDSESTEHRGTQSRSTNDPPMDLLTEQPDRSAGTGRHPKVKQKKGYSLWKDNVDQWTRSAARAAAAATAKVPPVPSSTSPDVVARGPLPNRRTQQRQQQQRQQQQQRIDPESGIPRRRSKSLDDTVAGIYLISLAVSLATATIVAASAPSGDSSHIYPIFVYSAKSLVLYAAIAAAISAVWLFCFRNFTRAAVQISVFAVPAILGCTSLASIIMSVHYTPLGWHGLAHAAMRFSALVPLGLAALWVLYLRHTKDVMGKAADIVVLSAEVYNQCTPAMTVLTFLSGIASLVMTGLWTFFLAKAFLEGKMGIILIIWFSFMYVWTWGVFSSLLRAVLTLVTATWYVQPPITSPEDYKATDGLLGSSIYKAVTFHFSSVCISALVTVLIRLPLLILPSRLSGALRSVASVTLCTSSVYQILDPLILPISVLDRCSLSEASNQLASPRFSQVDHRAYHLANRFLMAGRVCCSLLVGFVAWIHADRVQDVSSVHGYLIAIVAWFIGWTVMGSSESMLSMINDALLVSYVLNPESYRHKELQRLFGIEQQQDVREDSRESDFSD